MEVENLKEMCFGVFQGSNYIEMEKDPDYDLGRGGLHRPRAGSKLQGDHSAYLKPSAASWRVHWQLARKSW